MERVPDFSARVTLLYLGAPKSALFIPLHCCVPHVFVLNWFLELFRIQECEKLKDYLDFYENTDVSIR